MAQTVIILLFENTLTFTALFAAIWLIKKLLRRSLSVRLHYVIWAVVVLKLLIPFSFTTAWSPYTLLQQPDPVATNSVASETESGNTEDTPTTASAQAGAVSIDPLSGEAVSAKSPALLHSEINWYTALMTVWLIGAVSYAIWLWHKNRLLIRAVRRCDCGPPPVWMLSVVESCREHLYLNSNVRIIVQSAVQVPAVIGLFVPTVIIPAWYANAQNADRFKHIFVHELAHCKRRDIAVIWLLNVLRSLYWFNPLVWLCFRLVQRDMEADCDSTATQALGPGQLKAYIETILFFSGRQQSPMFQAAMSLNDGCVQMKQRIRSLFMRSKAKPLVRAATLALALILTFAAFTAGCGHIGTSAASTYSETGHWTANDIHAGSHIIHIDAQILMPDTDEYPIYELERGSFSQQQIDKLVSYFFGGGTLYTSNAAANLKSVEKRLEYFKQQYKQTGSERTKMEIQTMETIDIAAAQSNVDENTEGAELAISNGRLQDSGLDVWVDMDGYKQGSLLVSNRQDDSGVNPSIQLALGEEYTPNKLPFCRQADGIKTTPEQARQLVQQMLDTCGFEDITAQYVFAGNIVDSFSGDYREDLPGGYQVVCFQQVDGFNIYVTAFDEDTSNEAHEEIWAYVDDTGMTGLDWLCHNKIGKKVKTNAELLPLASIQQIFTDSITEARMNSTNKAEQTVNRIDLELARVKDRSGQWLLVPAWTFYATSKFWTEDDSVVEADHPGQVIRCINAIDGSIIW